MPNASEAADSALLDAARAARDRAYAPYSQFRVGAALRYTDGAVYSAANVENASYGLSMCAERAALFAAVASGRLAFDAIAVAGPERATTPPCGACRQVLAEFGMELRVLYTTPQGGAVTSLEALLPVKFELP